MDSGSCKALAKRDVKNDRTSSCEVALGGLPQGLKGQSIFGAISQRQGHGHKSTLKDSRVIRGIAKVLAKPNVKHSTISESEGCTWRTPGRPRRAHWPWGSLSKAQGHAQKWSSQFSLTQVGKTVSGTFVVF